MEEPWLQQSKYGMDSQKVGCDASVIRGMSAWAKKPENVMKAKDPYVLFPNAPEEKRVDEKWTTKQRYEWDSYFSTISGPYFMAPTDNRLVRRSLALRDIWCSYDEAFSVGAIMKVTAFALTHYSAMRAGQNPKPGEGKSCFDKLNI